MTFSLEAEEKMTKTEEVVLHEFAGVRTGKASLAGRKYHGGCLRVTDADPRAGGNHYAGAANAPDSTLTHTLHPIEKAIQKSNPASTPRLIKTIRIFCRS